MANSDVHSRLAEARTKSGLGRREVAERFGISVAAVSSWEGKGSRPTLPERTKLPKLAELYGVSLGYLLGEDGADAPAPNARPGGPVAKGVRDLPVFASARGGAGEMATDTGPIDWIERPANLSHVPDAFAVYVVGDSMEPRFSSGELVMVHPHRPVRIGQDVLVEAMTDDGASEFLVKRLAAMDPENYTFEQFNPAKRLKIARSRVIRCLNIVGVSFV